MFEDILGSEERRFVIEIICPNCDYVIVWKLVTEEEYGERLEWGTQCMNCLTILDEVIVRETKEK